MITPIIISKPSTSNVDFRNTSGSYYDMIITISNNIVNQSITIYDTEGNLITKNPVIFTVNGRMVLKDVRIGTIEFSDTNSYNIYISYVVKRESSGIPYIELQYSNYISNQTKIFDTSLSGTGLSILMSDILANSQGKLRYISIYWIAAATQTDNFTIYKSIYDSSFETLDGGSYVYPNSLVYNGSIDVTESDIYGLVIAPSSANASNVGSSKATIGDVNTLAANWSFANCNPITLSPYDKLNFSTNETNGLDVYLSFEVSSSQEDYL